MNLEILDLMPQRCIRSYVTEMPDGLPKSFVGLPVIVIQFV